MKRYTEIVIILLFFSLILNTAGAEEVLTWQDCVKEAAKNHPDLISSQENVAQLQAAKNITASTLLPQIDANAESSKVKSSGKTTDTYTYGVTGTQLIFDGAKTSNNVKAAGENIKAAKFNYKFTSSEVRLRLRSAFISLLKTQELLNLTEEIRKIRRDNLVLITLRYESGMEHRGALLTAEANSAEAEFEIKQAQRALEVSQRQLIKEMGRTKFSPLLVKDNFKVSDTVLEKPDFESLAKNNPSLEKLVAQRNAADFGIKAAVANFFPQFSAQAGADRTSSHWPPRNDQWNAGFTLSFPLFEGGLRLAQIAQARAIFNQAQANERSSKDALIATLEQTWAVLQDSIETVGVEKKFLDAAEERSQIAQAQYSTGFISYDNWTIIQDDLVRTKKSFLDTQANALISEANWIQAKGETLEYEN